jgi:hypothetical protein
LYITSLGIEAATSSTSYRQWSATLQAQYRELSEDQRTLARATGRKLIKESASLRAAAATLGSPLCLQVQASKSSTSHGLSRAAIFALISQRWSPLTPPCPTCRMSGGFPKRSWPTREWAEEVWLRQHDRASIRIYSCPTQIGFWHLGHIRRRTELPGIPAEGFSATSSLCQLSTSQSNQEGMYECV